MSTLTMFRGYPTDLLMSIKHHGRALVNDDDLYEAAQAYTDPAAGGGIFGAALLNVEPQRPVPASLHDDPPGPQALTPPASEDDDDDDVSPWDALSLLELRDILQANKVEYPRTMTKGSAIKRLEAANIAPPT